MSILEHEIPDNTRLYFDKSACLKREIENTAANMLQENGFKEIVTPFFSYHQTSSMSESKIIKFNDHNNDTLSLRADSTFDVAKIITKRLPSLKKHTKWFYIQPVFKYPSVERYQIGVEYIGSSDMNYIIKTATKILNKLNINPALQLANIAIPKLVAKELDIDIEIFDQGPIDKLFEYNIDWLDALLRIHSKECLIKTANLIPDFLKDEFEKLLNVAKLIEYNNLIISPLYYSKLKYYNNMFFRFIDSNNVLSRGGEYNSDDINSIGFALYTDNIIEGNLNEMEKN